MNKYFAFFKKRVSYSGFHKDLMQAQKVRLNIYHVSFSSHIQQIENNHKFFILLPLLCHLFSFSWIWSYLWVLHQWNMTKVKLYRAEPLLQRCCHISLSLASWESLAIIEKVWIPGEALSLHWDGGNPGETIPATRWAPAMEAYQSLRWWFRNACVNSWPSKSWCCFKLLSAI